MDIVSRIKSYPVLKCAKMILEAMLSRAIAVGPVRLARQRAIQKIHMERNAPELITTGFLKLHPKSRPGGRTR